MEIVLFYLFAALIIVSALAVVAMPNPIHSTLSLIVTLIGVACLFALMKGHFLATVQIIVYSGAIVVLVLFVLMLLNIKEEVRGNLPYFSIAMLLTFSAILIALLAPLFIEGFSELPLAVKNGSAIEGTVENLGMVLYEKFYFPFELASLLIMAALIGAVMIGRSRKSGIFTKEALDSDSLRQSVVEHRQTENKI
jgi:NADH-quinone oxidoreductase subunit J